MTWLMGWMGLYNFIILVINSSWQRKEEKRHVRDTWRILLWARGKKIDTGHDRQNLSSLLDNC